MSRSLTFLLHAATLCTLAGCPGNPVTSGVDSGTDCQPCTTSADCSGASACVQLGGTDTCARDCAGPADCRANEACLPAVASDGSQTRVCVPSAGCGGNACPGGCASGTTCDVVAGWCAAPSVDAGSANATCGSLDSPATASCCHTCTPTTASCQANGCFGGFWCEKTQCRCQQAPASCAPFDAGTPSSSGDGGAPAGSVGPSGGTVNRLYFAVVGDTRPAIPNDTARYPTAIITSIYQDIQGMNPRPQFVVGTGDYQFAGASSAEAGPQMNLYMGARSLFTGPLFAAMGNHECTGATLINCAGGVASNPYQAFLSLMMQPLGHTDPYYSVDVNGQGGGWTAKFIVTACNSWDATQKSWLAAQLARSTTYTFVVRHIPLGVSAPCTAEMDPMLSASPYTMLLVGHTHTWRHSGKELVEGTGGAPITGSATYGYATVEQLASGGFKVTQYDAATKQAVGGYTLP